MIFRAQIGFPFDSALPQDVVTVNPHYFGDNAQAIADTLRTNLIAKTSVGASTPFTIKVYDAQKAPPSYPLATATNGTGFKVTTSPRELALCLSYYSTYNRPGYRGRLYIPHTFLSGTLALRPTQAQRDDVLSWRTVFGSGLPASHNWVVYSRRQDKSYGVSNVWVDDEWDIQRSRGLKPTARSLATVP